MTTKRRTILDFCTGKRVKPEHITQFSEAAKPDNRRRFAKRWLAAQVRDKLMTANEDGTYSVRPEPEPTGGDVTDLDVLRFFERMAARCSECEVEIIVGRAAQ